MEMKELDLIKDGDLSLHTIVLAYQPIANYIHTLLNTSHKLTHSCMHAPTYLKGVGQTELNSTGTA